MNKMKKQAAVLYALASSKTLCQVYGVFRYVLPCFLSFDGQREDAILSPACPALSQRLQKAQGCPVSICWADASLCRGHGRGEIERMAKASAFLNRPPKEPEQGLSPAKPAAPG